MPRDMSLCLRIHTKARNRFYWGHSSPQARRCTVDEYAHGKTSGNGLPRGLASELISSRPRRRSVRAGEIAHTADVVPIARMTSRQLIRRAKIIEAVVDAIGDVGPESVQMRDVAQRSGVALATAYRYFRSKEHLLAAALEDWQERLTRRTVSAKTSDEQDPLSGVLTYLRRAQRAFSRNPEMTALMLQMMTSTDPDVSSTIDRMNRNNADMFARLLHGLPPSNVPNLSFALNAILTSAITRMLNGRMSLDESQMRVEWAARALLEPTVAQRDSPR